jgi:hypothetical protein
VAAACCVAWPVAAAAQEFQPPRAGGSGAPGTRLGLYGFGLRGGGEVSGSTPLVVGATLDVGNLVVDRLRLRASGEIGVDGLNSYVASGEVLFRFTGDDELFVPYFGGGLSLAGHDDCGGDPACPAVWANVAFGVERRFRSTFNWVAEYHGMDLLRRHRLYLGLTTRRGG